MLEITQVILFLAVYIVITSLRKGKGGRSFGPHRGGAPLRPADRLREAIRAQQERLTQNDQQASQMTEQASEAVQTTGVSQANRQTGQAAEVGRAAERRRTQYPRQAPMQSRDRIRQRSLWRRNQGIQIGADGLRDSAQESGEDKEYTSEMPEYTSDEGGFDSNGFISLETGGSPFVSSEGLGLRSSISIEEGSLYDTASDSVEKAAPAQGRRDALRNGMIWSIVLGPPRCMQPVSTLPRRR